MRRNKNSNNGKRNQGNGKEELVRLSGNVKPEEKTEWWEMVLRAAKIDGIHDPNSGTFLSRIINRGLRLDDASLSEYQKTHTKRRRDEDPARI